MAIYFLQRTSPPVLPVLHEELRPRASPSAETPRKSSPTKKTKKTASAKKQSTPGNDESDDELNGDAVLNESMDEALREKSFETFKINLQDYVN
jgi:hypothetical protein